MNILNQRMHHTDAPSTYPVLNPSTNPVTNSPTSYPFVSQPTYAPHTDAPSTNPVLNPSTYPVTNSPSTSYPSVSHVKAPTKSTSVAALATSISDKADRRRALGDVKDASLSDVLEEMKDAFEDMFPISEPEKTWGYKTEYNFAEFTKAFNLMFGDFDFGAKVPDSSCSSTDPCYTGHSNTQQTTASEDNIKRVVAFLWAHVQQESDGLKAVKEYDCATNTQASVCCSYNHEGTCDANTASSKKYFGRGALQLSHDYNYKKFGKWTNKLSDDGLKAGTNLNNFIGFADKVVSSSYAWLSGMWFFVDAKMHICGSNGAEDIVSCFQRTTNKINGDQECESTSTTHKDEDKTRLGYLIKAYKALNGDENKGIPKGDGAYYNSVSDIPTTQQTCDFCRETTSTDWKDCTDEDKW